MDIQHKGISTVIESSGELETSEEKALEYKNSVLE
jgi:hypothetical protein